MFFDKTLMMERYLLSSERDLAFFFFLTGMSEYIEEKNMRAEYQLIKYEGRMMMAPLNPPISPNSVSKVY